MLRRVIARGLDAVAAALVFAWLACSVTLSIWLVSATGIPVGRKGGAGLCGVILLVPIGVYVALDEFVVRRIRYGPPVPGRPKRAD